MEEPEKDVMFYRSKPIRNKDFEIAILERDLNRLKENSKYINEIIKIIVLLLAISAISILISLLVRKYFVGLLGQSLPSNCLRYTYDLMKNFIPKCEICFQKYIIDNGECIKSI